MNMKTIVGVVAGAVVLLVAPQAVMGQDRIAEGHVGRAWFLDESAIDHNVAGGGVRFLVTERIAIGPEFTYMNGPELDEDWFLTGNATVDIGPLRWRSRVMPYAVVGGGVMYHSNMINGVPFSSTEGAVTLGGGARITSAGRWFVAPEARIGWEAHSRIGISVGMMR